MDVHSVNYSIEHTIVGQVTLDTRQRGSVHSMYLNLHQSCFQGKAAKGVQSQQNKAAPKVVKSAAPRVGGKR